MVKSLLSTALASTFIISPLSLANKAGDFIVRGGLTTVDPASNKAAVFLDSADSGLEVSVKDNSQLGLNFVYFYDNNFAIELLAATPFKHKLKLHSGDVTTLAEVSQLPPTLSALYYFDSNSVFKPYIGAGINYTIFFDDSFTTTYKDAGFSDLDLDRSFGLSLLVGTDFQLNRKWSLNVSARYINIDTESSFKVGGSVSGTASVEVDPLVFSLMLGHKF